MERKIKKPEEIKKGLDCISRHRMENCGLECDKCEAYVPGWTISGICAGALALIQQLEAKDAEKDQRIAELEQELAVVKRERDASVDGFRGDCRYCMYFHLTAVEEPCKSCVQSDNYVHEKWQWCGFCLENTEGQDG